MRSATLTSFGFKNEPGTIADIGAVLAIEDLDVLGFTTCAKESTKRLHLVTEDPDPLLAMLDTVGLSRRSQQVLIVSFDGGARELGELGRRLADAGVNVEASLWLANGADGEIALAVDDITRAQTVLEREETVQTAP